MSSVANLNRVQVVPTKLGTSIRLYTQDQYDWLDNYVRHVCRLSEVRFFRTPHAESIGVYYVNTKTVPDGFAQGIYDHFDVVNDSLELARKKIEISHEIARRAAIAKSKLARHNLTSLKQAMVVIYGSPQAVKDAFREAGIWVRGHATLTQCLSLLEYSKLLKATLEYMEIAPICEVALSTPFASPLACLVVYDEPVECEAMKVTYDFMVDALTPMSLSELRAHMKDEGISGKGTRGYSQSQLLDHCLEYWFTRLS